MCVQYIEAIRKIHSINPDFRPQRTIHLTFVPDEEVGGSGMIAFLSSTLYKSMPGVALALDEGLASTDDTYSLFYGERWDDLCRMLLYCLFSFFLNHNSQFVHFLVKVAVVGRCHGEGTDGARIAIHRFHRRGANNWDVKQSPGLPQGAARPAARHWGCMQLLACDSGQATEAAERAEEERQDDAGGRHLSEHYNS